ncbi:SEC-C metal-binding domain-containing protein [Cetobacterium sp.]|uniref:SEC-C metal-binding domain-containing protein n=1 Tax=Cetobacterium sp. TaxID=2071632 RepID=UPI003F36825A
MGEIKINKQTLIDIYDLKKLKNKGFEIKETSKRIIIIGMIKINHSYETDSMIYTIKDTEFKIKMIVSKKRDELPKVFELSNKIPKEYHKYFNEELCLGYPLYLWDIYSQNKSLEVFINKFIIPYFFRFCCLTVYNHPPVGEYSHANGTLEYFKDILGINQKYIIASVLELYLLDKNVSCPCESGLPFKSCHFQKINILKSIPKSILRKKLEFLKKLS